MGISYICVMDKSIQISEQTSRSNIGNVSRHVLPFAKAIAKRKANAQFKKFKNALEEVEQIEAGLIKPKTLQQLLNEL
jgi:hypothetical protein